MPEIEEVPFFLKKKKGNAIDLIEDFQDAWHSTFKDRMNEMSHYYNTLVKSENFAKSSGMFLNYWNSYENFLKTIFPYFPMPTIEQRQMFLEIFEKMAASYLSTMSKPWVFDMEKHALWSKLIDQTYPIAPTQRETIWKEGIVELYYYNRNPSAPIHYKEPLILVFAIMNTPWIFDLQKGNSFIEYMTNEGYEVYLVNWGSPTLKEKNWTFSTYVQEILPKIVAHVKKHSGSNPYSLLGWCLGALIVALHASLQPKDLKNIILLTPPLDFSDEELIFKKWIKYLDVDLLIKLYGNMPAAFLELGAQSLKPIENIFLNQLKLYDRLDDKYFVNSWQAMHTWLSMNIPMAGATYLELTKRLYGNNELVKGDFDLNGTPTKLENIKAATLAMIGDKDYLTPPSQMESAFPLIGSKDKTLLSIHGGHIGGMAGSKAKQTWKSINKWLSERCSGI
jgi:polyhydroxyalkanoate synthase